MRYCWRILPALAFGLVTACSVKPAPQHAGLVFKTGAVYTMNPAQPWANAVAVRDGRITWVGDDRGVDAWVGPETRIINLQGRMLLPGFHDSHMHPMAAGTRFLRCRLENLSWPEAVLQKLADCARGLKPGEWLRAIGLADRVLKQPVPDKSLIDPFTSHTPAIIELGQANSFWVNSYALNMAGINAGTPDPPGGHIERNPESGEPNGILRGSASRPVYDLIPPLTVEQLRLALKMSSEMANGFGITSSNEASAHQEHIEAYLRAEAAGEMTLRVQASQIWDRGKDDGQIEQLLNNRQRARGTFFTANSVKLFLDGDVYWKSAALLHPYTGTDDEFGRFNYDNGSMLRIVSKLDELGFDLHMHAYGDAAVRQGLDALEYAFKHNPHRDRRSQIAHLALVDKDDLGRFAALGVTADVQALWAHLNKERLSEGGQLGPDRFSRMIPLHSLFANGARVVGGSDWTSESMNPLVAMQYALTRRSLDGTGPAWNPQERVTLEQMLRAYTIDGAWLARQENETGSIEVGKAADLVVLDQNLFEADPEHIANVRVLLTLLKGVEVYREVEFD